MDPNIDKAAKLIESFLGAPIIVDAAGLGSAAHRVRLFWTNWCRPEILQEAIPKNILPNPTLQEMLHDYHVPTIPSRVSIQPFAQHNKVGYKRVCLPTIVSYPKSHAYRPQANGTPGEGQLWNTNIKCWEIPTLQEKEQLLGYRIDSTNGGLATDLQRVKRLGQAMAGNTMRWLGAFLYATYNTNNKKIDHQEGIGLKGGFSKRKNRIALYFNNTNILKENNPHHQAMVEDLIRSEGTTPGQFGGG